MEIFNLGGGIYPKCSFLDGLAFCGVKVTNVFILVKKTIVGFKKRSKWRGLCFFGGN